MPSTERYRRTQWTQGNVVEFQDDGELCLVTSVATNTLNVVRNYQFSVTATAGTGTSHANGIGIVKNPVYEYVQIKDAISAVVLELWPYVYTKVTATITPLATVGGLYSVAATFEKLSSAVQRDTSTAGSPCFYGGRRSYYPISLLRGLPDNFPTTEDTGKAVSIPSVYNLTNTIFVTGVRRLTDATTTPGTYDDLTDGVEVECVVYLAIHELLGSKDIPRSASDDTTMADSSVVAGRRTAVADTWLRKGLRKRRQWEADLRTSLPILESYGRSY